VGFLRPVFLSLLFFFFHLLSPIKTKNTKYHFFSFWFLSLLQARQVEEKVWQQIVFAHFLPRPQRAIAEMKYNKKERLAIKNKMNRKNRRWLLCFSYFIFIGEVLFLFVLSAWVFFRPLTDRR